MNKHCAMNKKKC